MQHRLLPRVVDEVALWDRVLTGANVQEIYQRGLDNAALWQL